MRFKRSYCKSPAAVAYAKTASAFIKEEVTLAVWPQCSHVPSAGKVPVPDEKRNHNQTYYNMPYTPLYYCQPPEAHGSGY